MSAPMKKKKKSGSGDHNKLIAIIAIALGVILVACISIYFITYYSNNYIGKVGGEKVYDYEFSNYLQNELNELTNEMDVTDDMTDEERTEKIKEFLTTADKDGKYALDRVQANALDKLRLLKTEAALAKEAGFALTSDEISNVKANVDGMINYYYSLYQQQGSSATYDQVREMVCGPMTTDQYKEYVQQDTTISKWKEALKKDYEVSDEDARKIYDENPDNYKEVTIQKLFLSTKTEDEEGNSIDMTAEEKAAVLEKANEYMYKFADGSLDFEATIKAESDEENSSDNAGVTTISVSSKSGSENLDKWAFSREKADDDNVYTVVEDDNGVYVVKCTAVEDFDNSEHVDADPANNVAEKKSIKETIIDEIKSDKADKEVEDKATEAMKTGYELTDINESRIKDLFEKNEYVLQIVELYGAKYSK